MAATADFIGKYYLQIQKNRDKITAYEGAYDIVNILLTSIAGKRLVIETGSITPKNNHKPNHILDTLGHIGLPGKRHVSPPGTGFALPCQLGSQGPCTRFAERRRLS